MIRTESFKMRDGIDLIADVAGPSNGPTLLLAHGGGQTRHAWAGAVRAFANAGYYVINYDCRGHGESDWSIDNKYPIPRLWEDMLEISKTRPQPVALVGSSMGGMTALQGISQGFVPQAAVLVDIAPNAARKGVDRVREFMENGLRGFESVEEVADAVAAYNPHRARPVKNDGLLKNLRRKEDGRLYWHWDPGMLDRDMDQHFCDMDIMFDRLKQMTLPPTLLVRGAQSDVVTADTASELLSALPGVELAEVEHAGHMVAGDSNEAFVGAALSFLHRVLPAKRDAHDSMK